MIKVKYFFISIFLFLTFIIPINALGNIADFSKKGSVEIILNENKESIKNMEITIYQIALAKEIDNNLSFEYVDELKKCNADINDLTNNNLSIEILKCINDEKVGITKISNEFVKFDTLPLGLYLIKQEKKIEGLLSFEPFLIVTPKLEKNNWVYDIKAKPKTEIYELIDIKVNKVWNTKSEKIPEKVTIQLYKDLEIIDTVILNNNNNWTHIWDKMEKSDKYSVKEIDIPKGYTVSYKKNEYNFTVINTNKLPETGQNYYPIYIFFSIGLIFILLGFIQLKKEVK